MTTYTSPRTMSDVLKWEVNPYYTRTAGTIQNKKGSTSTANTNPVGLPVKSDGAGGYAFCLGSDEANATGVIIQGPAVEALANNARTAGKYVILVRGPALIDKAQIPSADSEGTTIVLATLLTALAALGIRPLSEPTVQGTQTT